MKAIFMTPLLAAAALLTPIAGAAQSDPRLREVTYDAQTVVTVPVKRGIVTHVVLDADEAITEVGAGLGGDCAKPDAAWCIATQPGGRNIFVKPKSTASAPNNLAVVTDRRTHAFRFVPLADGDPRPAVYRLVIRAPAPRVQAASTWRSPDLAPSPTTAPVVPTPTALELVADRIKAKPQVLNTSYSIAEGKASEDIVPTLVFDDGRFTYLRFPGNREIPAVFHVLGDGGESLVNARMEDDLLVVDRVSRRLVLRAGSAVAGLWNEAFDIDGVPPVESTTVPGVRRLLRAEHAVSAPATTRATAQEPRHE